MTEDKTDGSERPDTPVPFTMPEISDPRFIFSARRLAFQKWKNSIAESYPNYLEERGLALHASFREKVAHEDGLVNSRTSWLLVSQSILFAALVFWLENFVHYPGFWLIAVSLIAAGVISAVSTFISVRAAFFAINETQCRWLIVRQRLKHHRVLPAVAGGWEDHASIRFGAYAALSIPFILAIAWLLVAGSLYVFDVPKPFGDPAVHAVPELEPSPVPSDDSAEPATKE